MKKILFLLAGLVAAWNATAGVDLPDIIGSDMVLQRNASVRLWGWADADAAVKIATSWGEKTTVRSGGDGRWIAEIRTPEGSFAPQRITIVSGEKVTLDNVLIGEVWFAGGQSNMEMPIIGWPGQPVKNATETIILANSDVPIRHCYVKRSKSFDRQDRCEAVWNINDGHGVAEASAIAYFFAKKLYDVLKVPVGVINASWGGTAIEGWMSKEILDRNFPGEIDMSAYVNREWPDENNHTAPASLYNGMLHSVLPFTARGFIWYQGENNRDRAEQYSRLQPAFVKMLRDEN